MGLTPEQIQAIYETKLTRPASRKTAQGGGVIVKGKRKQSRIATHFPKLPPNKLVYHINGPSIDCESTGCRAPSYHRVRGQPLCSLHIVFALVHEINRLSHNGALTVAADADQSAGLTTIEPGTASSLPIDGNPAEQPLCRGRLCVSREDCPNGCYDTTGDTSPMEVVSDNEGYL